MSTSKDRLLCEAIRYKGLGYSIALTKGKSVVTEFIELDYLAGNEDFDGISFLLEGIACVDFDDILSFDVGWRRELPPTLKERSPRGYHLFYLIPWRLGNSKMSSKIKWLPHVDLLTNVGDTTKVMYNKGQGKEHSQDWGGHVLVSPSNGYRRIWPDEIPKRDLLTPAPEWLREELRKSPNMGPGSSMLDG